MMRWIILGLSIFLGSIGQVMFKMAVDSHRGTIHEFFKAIILDRHLVIGVVAYGFSFLLWLWVLRFFDVSLARPLTALGYVATYALAIAILGEPFSLSRLTGVVLIVVGAVVLVL